MTPISAGIPQIAHLAHVVHPKSIELQRAMSLDLFVNKNSTNGAERHNLIEGVLGPLNVYIIQALNHQICVALPTLSSSNGLIKQSHLCGMIN